MPTDVVEEEVDGEAGRDRIGAEEGLLDAGAAGSGVVSGQSEARRALGLAGQYGFLVALAAVALAPVVLTAIQSLSPPFPYLNAGKPLHPVSVSWKDRTWFSGGTFSVAARSLGLLVTLAWIQLRTAGGGPRDLAPLRQPRRIAAVVLGFAAIAGLSGQIIASLVERSPATSAWFLGSIAVVAAVQLVGFAGGGRSVWSAAINAAVAGVGLVGLVVLAIGPEAWNQAWDMANLGPALQRSLVVTTLIVACQVVTSVFAAYAFAFLRFPLKALVFGFFMATMLLPVEVTLLANVQLIRDLGWIDSTQALVLPFAAVAFGTFLIRQGFRGIPPEIYDAARLDGYSHLTFMWRFAVPLTRPVIAAFTVVAALAAWNQYLWPQAVIDDRRQETAQIALRSIAGADIANANMAIAAALVVSLPVVALLFAFQRQIVRGLTAGAVK